MKITTLIENKNTGNEMLLCEHGLSLLIETHGKRLLFDTGATGAFVENAAALGVDLGRLDAVIISHAHYDHSGGVKRFLGTVPAGVHFLLGEDYFKPKYKQTAEGVRYIGSSFEKEDLHNAAARLSQVSATTALGQGIYLVKNFTRTYAFEPLNPNFVLPHGDGWQIDPFWDELALAIETRRGLVVVAGCSHCGVANLLSAVSATFQRPVVGVIGGSHLVEADYARITKTITAFKKIGLKQCWLSHCTGEIAGERFAEAFGKNYKENHTGNVIEIPE